MMLRNPRFFTQAPFLPPALNNDDDVLINTDKKQLSHSHCLEFLSETKKTIMTVTHDASGTTLVFSQGTGPRNRVYMY